MKEFSLNKSNSIENCQILDILEFSLEYYNNNHLFNDILYEMKSDFCYNVDRYDYVDPIFLDNLGEIIDYQIFHKKMIEHFNNYIKYRKYTCHKSINEMFIFDLFSLNDFKKIIIMNEIIHYYNMTEEFFDLFSLAKDINTNLKKSIIFIIENYHVFSLNYLNITKKDDTYREQQAKYTIEWFEILTSREYLKLITNINENHDMLLDNYYYSLYENGIYYDFNLLEDTIYYVGLYSEEINHLFDMIICQKNISNNVDFLTSSSMFKIIELMINSKHFFYEYSKLLVNDIIDNKNKFLHNNYNRLIPDAVTLLKYLKLCLKLSYKHNLKQEMNLIMQSYKTIFFVNDVELIDIILSSKCLLLSQDLNQLQYMHHMMSSYIDINLSINNLSDFDEISYKQYLIKKILEIQSIAKGVIEYNIPICEKIEYGKEMLDELNDYFNSPIIKELNETDLVSLLMVSIHLINRFIEAPYCSKLINKDNIIGDFFLIKNNEFKKYQKLSSKMELYFKLIEEKYQVDSNFSDWVDSYHDSFCESSISFEGEISMNLVISMIRVKKCHDYLYELDDKILDLRSITLNIDSTITDEKKRRIYKVLQDIKIITVEKNLSKIYVDSFQLKRLEQLNGCFNYLCSAEDYWNSAISRDTNRIDYTPYVANYIKLIEILLKEIVKKYIDRKKSVGMNVVFKLYNGSSVNLTSEIENYHLTLGDLLHFIKNNDDIIILDKKSVVFDYLFYFKDKIRNSKFHTAKISEFQEAHEIRYFALLTLKRILYDIY